MSRENRHIERQVESNSTVKPKVIYYSEKNKNEGKATMLKAQDFLDYIKQSKAKQTFKQYKSGLGKFVEWYGKSLDEILEERRQDLISENATQRKRFVREIEKFHKAMIDKGLTINSARANTLGTLQFFRYFEMPITIEKGSSVSQTVETTKDFVPTIEQYRAMFNCGDLRSRILISMGLDLGYRIGDFLSIQKAQIPDLNQETPIPFELITQKESVIAKSFISAESVELLKTYLPTLKPENPYLFQSNTHNHLDGESIGDILKNLATKSHITIPQGKRLRFHAFRKRFLSTCADLKVDINTAKILVGKDVESSMLAYLSEVNHKKAFLEVKSVLNLTNGRIKATVDSKDKEILELQKQVNEQTQLMKAMTSIFGKEILQKAKAQLTQEGFREVFVFGDRDNTYYAHEDKTLNFSVKRDDATELLSKIAELQQKKQKQAYEKMLENGDNNHD